MSVHTMPVTSAQRVQALLEQRVEALCAMRRAMHAAILFGQWHDGVLRAQRAVHIGRHSDGNALCKRLHHLDDYLHVGNEVPNSASPRDLSSPL